MVGAHHLDRSRREQADAVELSALQQHLAETGVIHGRGEESTTAGRALRNHRRVGPVHVDLETGACSHMDFSQARELLLRNVERGVFHAEWLKDAGAGEVRERLAGEFFDQVALYVHGNAIGPTRARLREQRDLREAVNHGLQRGGGVQHVSINDHLVDRAQRVQDIAEACRVSHQFAHRHGAARVLNLRRAIVIFPDDDFHAGKFGNVLRDRIVELPLPLFVQHHHGDAGNGLGHGVDPEDRIFLDSVGLLRVELADGVEVDDLAVARDQCDQACHLLVVDEMFHGGIQAGEALGRDAYGFGGGGGEGLCRSGLSRQSERGHRAQSKPSDQAERGFHRSPENVLYL